MAHRGWLPAMAVAFALAATSAAQTARKPLTNDDVAAMVKKKLPESVIVSAIRTGPTHFDTSPEELIRLNAAGVTENELNAMVAAAGSQGSGAHESATPTVETETSAVSRMPRVRLTAGGAARELKLERTQLTQTKTKPTSMGGLASDGTVTQAMQVGIGTASWDAAIHSHSYVGSSAIEGAGGILGGMMSHRTPTVTYVWGVPAASSSNLVNAMKPEFAVDFSRTPGIHADDYAPTIVKLTPAGGSCRIVGATQGKQDASASAAADWQMYSHFLEEPVAVKAEKTGSGQFRLKPANELLPGEYGVVLRPVDKMKKFSGGDVARGQGDGLMFDAIWTFKVTDDAH